jgi:AraC-like DNA-binding protein
LERSDNSLRIGEFANVLKAKRQNMKRIYAPSRYAIRAAIAASLSICGAKLPSTASQLKMSARSLQRRIAEIGSTYSELVDEVRLDTACHLLAQSDERVADIAARLGFAGASGFSRTFLRLTKIRPAVYRRQHCVRNRSVGGSRRSRKASAKRPAPAPE